MSESEFRFIPLSDIVRSPFTIREGSDLTELTQSIEEIGVVEPIVVRMAADGKYELVAGERRFSASKAAGLKEVPAIIRVLTDEQAFTIQSVENLHRADLTDKEKTALVTFYAERFEKKPKEIAKTLGMSHTWVLKYLPDSFKDPEMAELGKLRAESRADLEKGQDSHIATRRVATSELCSIPEKEADSDTVTTHVPLPPFHDMIQNSSKPSPENVHVCEANQIPPLRLPGCSGGVATSDCKLWHGHQLCSSCFERANRNPESYDGFFRTEERKKNGQLPKQLSEVKPRDYDTYAEKKAHMTVQHSKFEEDTWKLLETEEFKDLRPFTIGKEFCAVKTACDIAFMVKGRFLAAYADGIVHEGREERDERLRGNVERQGIAVLSFETKGKSPKEFLLACRERKQQLEEA